MTTPGSVPPVTVGRFVCAPGAPSTITPPRPTSGSGSGYNTGGDQQTALINALANAFNNPFGSAPFDPGATGAPSNPTGPIPNFQVNNNSNFSDQMNGIFGNGGSGFGGSTGGTGAGSLGEFSIPTSNT